jgi:hypothetical protein
MCGSRIAIRTAAITPTPAAIFTLTRLDEHGKERALFPYEREEVRQQRMAGGGIRQLGWLGYGVGVLCRNCRQKVSM